jgi:hypothetical protein
MTGSKGLIQKYFLMINIVMQHVVEERILEKISPLDSVGPK